MTLMTLTTLTTLTTLVVLGLHGQGVIAAPLRYTSHKHHKSSRGGKRITLSGEDHRGIVVSIDNMLINKEHKVRPVFTPSCTTVPHSTTPHHTPQHISHHTPHSTSPHITSHHITSHIKILHNTVYYCVVYCIATHIYLYFCSFFSVLFKKVAPLYGVNFSFGK